MRTSRRRLAHFIGALGVALALPVWAGTVGVQPTVTVSSLSEEISRFGLTELADDAPITLEWQASVFSTETYEYEITYDVPTTETSSATRVTLDDTESGNENQGVIESGKKVTITIRPSQIVAPSHLPSGGGANKTTRKIVLRVYRSATPYESTTSSNAAWTFEYDTRTPPAPSVTNVIPGENRVEVQWSHPASTTDVDVYEVVYKVLDTTVAPDPTTLDPDTFTNSTGSISKVSTSASVEDDALVNGRYVAVAVRSIDGFGNRGVPSAAAVGRPQEVSDFYELYRDRGGSEDGGFCFIATAAYGSYSHPAVRILRLYRDAILLTGPIGRGFVDFYYRVSPPIADQVRSHPVLRAAVQVALVPVGLFAVASLLAPFALAAWALMRTRRAWLAILIFCVPTTSRAELPGSRDSVGVAFEARGGPYLPEIGHDGSAAQGASAFADVFGTSPNPLYTLGADLLLYRGIGTAGVGGTFGFMQFVGRGIYSDSGQISHDTTVFNLLPLSLEAFYRFDWLAEELDIPLIPYVRGGLAYHFWWVTTGTGDIARQGDAEGRGGKLGLVGRLGVAVVLNILEPSAARALYESTGIRSTSIFGEVLSSSVDGFGDGGFELSDQTWNLGFYFEL